MRVAAVLLLVLLVLVGVAWQVGWLDPILAALGYRQLYLVALDDFPPETVEWLRAYYAERFGLKAQILPAIPLEARAIDARRAQVVGEHAVDVIKQAHPRLARSARAVVIGLTYRDMFILLRPDWRFAFSFYAAEPAAGRFGVVSTARMDPRFHRQRENNDVLYDRMRKIVSKAVAILFYDLSPNPNPRSVLYNKILGLEELDAIVDEFDPKARG